MAFALLTQSLPDQLCQNGPDGPGELEVVGALGSLNERNLRARGIEVIPDQDRGLTRIRFQSRQRMKEGLVNSLRSLDQGRRVAEHNIDNSRTTRTFSGNPFRALIPEFNDKGELEGVKEDSSDFNWVYDPGHPEALRSGHRKGYRATPNVNVKAELA